MCNFLESGRSLVCIYQNVFSTLPRWSFLASFVHIFFLKKKVITKCILARVLCLKLHPLGKGI